MVEVSQSTKTSSTADRMRAAQLVAPGRFEVVEIPIPEPGPGEVRVRIEGCGICASNIPPFEGRDWFSYPMAPGQLGHEAWGIVEAVGESTASLLVGDRVAFLSNTSYAEADVVAEAACVQLPPELAGRAFPGEPLACAVNIYDRARLEAGSTIAIVGIGFLGALLTQMAARDGIRVLAIGRRPYALTVAEAMGAADRIPMDDHWRIVDEVKRLTQGRGVDVVFECVGKQWPLDLATDLVREMGRMVIAGYHQDGLRQVNLQTWNWKGLDVINAHERENEKYLSGIGVAGELVANGGLDPYPLFTHEYSLDQIGQGLQDTIDRPHGFMKGIVRMNLPAA